MRQRGRAHNLTVCYRKKQMDVSFSCFCFHNIVKVICRSTATLTMLWRNSWSITGQTHKKLTSTYWLTGCREDRKAGETWAQVKKLTGPNKGICSHCECGADGNEYCKDSHFLCFKIPGCQETERAGARFLLSKVQYVLKIVFCCLIVFLI